MQHRVMSSLTNRICFWTFHGKEHKRGYRALTWEKLALLRGVRASCFSSENIIKCISAYKHSAKHACLFPPKRRVKLACSPNALHSHRETPDEFLYTFLSHFQTLTTSYNMWVATVLAFSNFQLQTWTQAHNTCYTSCVYQCVTSYILRRMRIITTTYYAPFPLS